MKQSICYRDLLDTRKVTKCDISKWNKEIKEAPKYNSPLACVAKTCPETKGSVPKIVRRRFPFPPNSRHRFLHPPGCLGPIRGRNSLFVELSHFGVGCCENRQSGLVSIKVGSWHVQFGMGKNCHQELEAGSTPCFHLPGQLFWGLPYFLTTATWPWVKIPVIPQSTSQSQLK